MRFKTFLSVAAVLAVPATSFTLPVQAAETTSGYSYTLHAAKPSVEDLGQFPPQYEDPIARHVLQGPEHTLMWRNSASRGDTNSATFALGERHMGLYVPYWEPGKSASETTGWNDYGDELTYSSFSVNVERAEGEREIAGGMAQHYVLTADYTRHQGDDPASGRNRIHSDLWVLADKPFSFAPFHVSGAYEDPRLGAAVVAELGELGMVVRSDARYSSVAVDDGGNETGFKHEGTLTTWIADLEPAEVPVVNLPVADHNTMDALQDGFRQHQDEACKAAIAGSTPEFIKPILSADQQPAALKDLRESCKAHVMRPFTQALRDDPQSECEGILAGETPDVVSQVLDEDEQKNFMQGAVSFCEKHAES